MADVCCLEHLGAQEPHVSLRKQLGNAWLEGSRVLAVQLSLGVLWLLLSRLQQYLTKATQRGRGLFSVQFEGAIP